MNRLAAVVALAVTAAARTAAAAPDPFKQYLSDLVSNPKAASAYLAHCDLALVPSGEVRTPCSLTINDLVGAQTGVTLVAKRVKDDNLSKSTVEYIDADVDAKAGGKVIASFHVLEVSGFAPDGFTPVAVHWTRTMPDKDATAKAKAKQLRDPAIKDVTVPMPKGTDEQAVNDYQEGVSEAKQWLSGDDVTGALPDVANEGLVFGSAAGQRYSGKSAARSLKGWKIALAQHGEYAITGSDLYVVVATELVGTSKDKDKVATPYAALLVMSMQMIEGSGDHVWYPRIISFAVPQ